MKKHFFTLLTIFLAVTSCTSQTLSKEEALKIVKTNLYIPKCYGEITCGTRSIWKTYQQDLKVIKKLEKEGLITTRKRTETISKMDRVGHTVISFSGAMKANIRYDYMETRRGFGGQKARVLLSEGKITKVSGISLSQGKNEATVLVQIEYTKTPFSELNSERYEPRECFGKDTEEKEVRLVKYDTGWRIIK